MKLIKKAYQKILSEETREKLTLMRGKPKNWLLKRKVIKRLLDDYKNDNDNEKLEVIEYLKKNPLQAIPYSFTDNYTIEDIVVLEDDDGYKYFVYDGKRIYGKKKWNTIDFQKYFRMIFIEQDKESPHCYFSRQENLPQADDIVADIGAAEGWFALQVVDRVKKVYCFEADPDWVEPLKRTIAPYKEKIELVESFVGGVSSKTISLDDFFDGKEITYIKADIEGFEKEMLENAPYTFTNKVNKAQLVMYHNQEDEQTLSEIMSSYGYKGYTNKGYILLYFSPGFKAPFVRRGVICFEK